MVDPVTGDVTEDLNFTGTVTFAGAGSGTLSTVKLDDSQVGGTDIVVLDFSTEFGAAESPDTEIQITIDAGITRDTEWDTFAELNAILGLDVDLATLDLPASTTISVFGASLTDDADSAAARTTLGLVIGTDVQAYDAVLAATTASFLVADETKLDAIEASATADQSDAEIENAYNAQVAAASQGEAEAGTEAAIRRFSPLRIAQAIAALESAAGSGSMTTVKLDDSQVGGTDIVVLDFSSEFGAAETPDTEIQVTIGPGITRDTEWDTFAELNAILGLDVDLATLDLPASTTISAFGATVIDDADASATRTTLGVDAAGTDNSTAVTLAGSLDYLTLSTQEITLTAIDLTTDVTGILPDVNVANALTIDAGIIQNTSYTIVGSTGPSTTTEGWMQWDTDDDRIVVGDGSAARIFSSDSDLALALNTEAELESRLTDVSDVFTDLDGALDDDDVTAADIGAASANIATDGTIEWEDAADLDATGAIAAGAIGSSETGHVTFQVAFGSSGTNLEATDDQASFVIPGWMSGTWNLTAVHVSVGTAGTTTNLPTYQIYNVSDAANMLSTAVTLDLTETGSDTALTAAVIDGANDDVTAYKRIRIDCTLMSSVKARGFGIATLEFTRQ
jgi:hypothetical protein